jgi:Winged helix-turn-helix DNA-binding
MKGHVMNREELAALRDAIDAVLTWRDGVREQVADWLTPEASKPNGRDPHPPLAAPTPRPAKARLGKPTKAQAAERRLIAALQANPSLSAGALATAASASRSTTGERLRRLATRGAIEKDAAGRWRVKGDEARPPSAPSG